MTRKDIDRIAKAVTQEAKVTFKATGGKVSKGQAVTAIAKAMKAEGFDPDLMEEVEIQATLNLL